MYIEELQDGDVEGWEEETLSADDGGSIVISDAKRVLVGVGARALFYPTLLYNVVRNKIQAEFRWWDRVDQFILLGAVPFPTDVPQLKELGVGGVITLNESYETLVPSSLYHTHGINHLVIATRDYCFAPSLSHICQAVDFIHKNASCGQTTYVHCKAGRGRSTTIVLCYLVRHKQMTPDAAYDYVKSVRPRVRLAHSQWQAVQKYYYLTVKPMDHNYITNLIGRFTGSPSGQDIVAFDESSVVVVKESDLDGYDPDLVSGAMRGRIWADLSVACRVQVAGQAALARISCLWIRCHAHQKLSCKKSGTSSTCSIRADHLGGHSLDIHVY